MFTILVIFAHILAMSTTFRSRRAFLLKLVHSLVAEPLPLLTAVQTLLFVLDIVRWVTDSYSLSHSRWFLQTYHIRLPFNSCLERGYGPYIRPAAVVLDHSDHCQLLWLPFQLQVQCRWL